VRPYGLPRNDDVQNPDASDERVYGLKGVKMKKRKARRRVWKKRFRSAAKKTIEE
jgi:hypothetical protein